MNERNNGWDRHGNEQLRAWLQLTHAQRLQWLEQAKRFSEVALGAARRGKPRARGMDEGAHHAGASKPSDVD